MAFEANLLENQLQPFPLMKLPSPIRRIVYKFVVLDSDDYQEHEADRIFNIQIARFIDNPKILRQEFQDFEGQSSLVLLDSGKAYPSTYSLESAETIKNLAQVLPKTESTELQHIFWQHSVLSIFLFASSHRPVFSRSTATEQKIVHGDSDLRFFAQNLECITRNIWSNIDSSSIRNLSIDLQPLSTRNHSPLKRILRLHLELDSLSLKISNILRPFSWAMDYNGYAKPFSRAMSHNDYTSCFRRKNVHRLKSLVVHKTFIVVLCLEDIKWPNDYDAQLTSSIRNLFLPYSLEEGSNRPFVEHESFGLEGLFKEERDEVDEKLDYLNDRAVVVRNMEEHLARMRL